jgi:hypothetical protein
MPGCLSECLKSADVPRARRPLIALIALVVALIVGYTVRAVRSDDGPRAPSRTPASSSQTAP